MDPLSVLTMFGLGLRVAREAVAVVVAIREARMADARGASLVTLRAAVEFLTRLLELRPGDVSVQEALQRALHLLELVEEHGELTAALGMQVEELVRLVLRLADEEAGDFARRARGHVAWLRGQG